MESEGVPTPARVFQDFEPSMEWVPEDDSDTLLVYLPGFAKEQLRVQLRARNLIISGERKLQQNTWSRFRVEFPVSANCDLNKLSAKFEGNILFVKQPKLISLAPKPEEEKPNAVAAPVATPQKPVDESNVGQKTAEEKPNAVAAPVATPQKPVDESNVGQKTAEEKPTAVAAPVATPQKPVDESNVGQKTAEENPTPTTQSNMENKEVGKEQYVPDTGVEEKSEKDEGKASESKIARDVRENASEKKTSDLDKKNKKVVYEELDKKTKKALEKYKRAVGVFAMKLKTSRNTVNTIVILLVGLVIGIYVSGSIKSWRTV